MDSMSDANIKQSQENQEQVWKKKSVSSKASASNSLSLPIVFFHGIREVMLKNMLCVNSVARIVPNDIIICVCWKLLF